MIDDDQMAIGRIDHRLDFEHLALAEQGRWPRRGDRHYQGFGDFKVNRAGQADGLCQPIDIGALVGLSASGSRIACAQGGHEHNRPHDAGLAVRVQEVT